MTVFSVRLVGKKSETNYGINAVILQAYHPTIVITPRIKSCGGKNFKRLFG